jgi:hypothetical protein
MKSASFVSVGFEAAGAACGAAAAGDAAGDAAGEAPGDGDAAGDAATAGEAAGCTCGGGAVGTTFGAAAGADVGAAAGAAEQALSSAAPDPRAATCKNRRRVTDMMGALLLRERNLECQRQVGRGLADPASLRMVRMMHAIKRDYRMAERPSGAPGCSASGGTMTPCCWSWATVLKADETVEEAAS